MYWNAQLLIMDEPTAALGVPEQRKVLALIRSLREEEDTGHPHQPYHARCHGGLPTAWW